MLVQLTTFVSEKIALTGRFECMYFVLLGKSGRNSNVSMDGRYLFVIFTNDCIKFERLVSFALV